MASIKIVKELIEFCKKENEKNKDQVEQDKSIRLSFVKDLINEIDEIRR